VQATMAQSVRTKAPIINGSLADSTIACSMNSTSNIQKPNVSIDMMLINGIDNLMQLRA
jgi:hypothetical protein